MKDVIWLIRNTLRITFKNKKNILLYLCTPLIGIFISFLSYGGSGQTMLQVGIVNNDSSYITTDTIKFIEGLKNVKVDKISKSEIDEAITAGKLDCVITFDVGFSQSIQEGKPNHIEITAIKGAETTGFIKSYLYNYIDNLISISKITKGDKDAFDTMYTNYQQAHFQLSEAVLKDTSKNKGITYGTIGYLLMIMLLSAGNLSEIIIKEKERKTYFRLLSTPIDAKTYVLSNIIVNMIVMTSQIILTLILITQVFHINMYVSFWQMAAVLMIFALVAIGLSLMIVAFASSSSAAGAMQNLFVTPTCLLAGCFFPIGIMPKAVQRIADFLPQRWALDILTKLQEGKHVGSLYLNVIILFAFAIAFFLIAIYKFGRNNHTRDFV
ncbi:ABC transporter permease [Ectobacillus funiculus]|uniref:ABC transporter permease n=1 Tax=Ectobacillus funiculus TaxID=137993 RepID=UPI00101BF1F3|nr:ABC transporter permease [Ectobacillus funiculus]